MSDHDGATFLIPYVGWKREGLRPFQESRLDLVRLMDRLITMLAEDPAHPGILLGGETIVLDDYDEIRGNVSQTIDTLVKSQRFIVGPWYVLPSEFLVSAESLVRNLLLGSQHLPDRSLIDTPSYLAPQASHLGQMPQILTLFGIETAITPHNQPEVSQTLHQWVGSDGSELKILHLPLLPFSSKDEGEVQQAETAVVYPIALISIAFGNSDSIEKFEKGQTAVSQLVAASAGSISTIIDLRDVQPPPHTRVGSNSARMWIKQSNHLVETLLLEWAEPFSAWVACLGEQVSDANSSLSDVNGIFRFAWQALVKNQSTEILSGNVIDLSADEAEVRFNRAEQIARYVIDTSLGTIASRIDTSTLQKRKQSFPIAVFNGTPLPRREVVSVTVPETLADASVEVINPMGKDIPFDFLPEAHDPLTAPHIEFAAEVPPTGYATYALRKSRKPVAPIVIDSGDSIENEFFSVQIEAADGTFSLYDKRTGRLFSGMNRYRDSGDCGDLAHYEAPERDTVIDIATNTPLRPQRRIGDVVQSLELFQIFRLPQTLTEDRSARLPLTAQFVPVSIWTTIRLVRGTQRVDVEVTVSNAALDHRLRVHFPTEIRDASTYIDGPYEVLDVSNEGSRIERAQRAFVTILGGDAGLTVSNRGLPEVSVLHHSDGTDIALTLLRSTGMTGSLQSELDELAPVLTPNGQCLGEYSYRYSLIPHGSDLLSAWREAWATQSDPMVIDATDSAGNLPSISSFVFCDNEAFLITSIKQAVDGSGNLIIRGYNLSSIQQKVALQLSIPIREVYCTGLDEKLIREKKVKANRQGRIRFEAAPLEIVTLRCAL